MKSPSHKRKSSVRFRLHEVPREVKVTETGSRMVIARLKEGEGRPGPLSKSKTLRTPGGSSHSQRELKATPGGSDGLKTGKTGQSDSEIGPHLGAKRMSPEGQQESNICVPTRKSSACMHPLLPPLLLQIFHMRKCRRKRNDEKRSLTCLPPLEQ